MYNMSGWPSGLRRQTQGIDPSLIRAFWSSNEGVGSNPTSDKNFFILFFQSVSKYKIWNEIYLLYLHF